MRTRDLMILFLLLAACAKTSPHGGASSANPQSQSTPSTSTSSPTAGNPVLVPADGLWSPDGMVTVTQVSGGTLYLGGQFSRIYKNVGPALLVDGTSGQPSHPITEINGVVHAAALAPDNGFYIGGDFTRVGGLARLHLAKLNADGSVDTSWKADADSSVRALSFSNGVLYVGGFFHTLQGQIRNSCGAIDSNGAVNSWQCSNDFLAVSSLLATNNTVYIAGQNVFTVGAFLASYDLQGTRQSWNPQIIGSNSVTSIMSLCLFNNAIYVGGFLSETSSGSTGLLMAVDLQGNVLAQTPAVTGGGINAIVTDGTNLYIGGGFTTVGGNARLGLASIDSAGNVSNWSPGQNYNFGITSLSISSGTLYAGGLFNGNYGFPIANRYHAAAFNLAQKTVTSWNPSLNDAPYAIVSNGSDIFLGGKFSGVGGEDRPMLASLDLSTGQPTNWNPSLVGWVDAFAVSGSDVYVSGGLVSAAGSQDGIFKFPGGGSVGTGLGVPGGAEVHAMAVDNNILYFGGNLTQVQGQTRQNLGAIDLSTDTVTSWAPTVSSGMVKGIRITSNAIYIVGTFTSVNGQPRNNVAALDRNGVLLPWDAKVTGNVSLLEVHNGLVYLSGYIGSVLGTNRSDLAAVDESGTLSPWHPIPTGSASTCIAIAVNATAFFCGGNATNLNGTGVLTELVEFDLQSGSILNNTLANVPPLTWGSLQTMSLNGTQIIFGGLFNFGVMAAGGPTDTDVMHNNLAAWTY